MPPSLQSTRRINTNWIVHFAENYKKITEAPHAYLVWAAISTVGAVLKNKVWVSRGTYKLYPNQYIVLVGPPGVGKGSSMDPAHNFARNNKPTPLCNYISDRATAPKIVEILSGKFTNTVIRNGLPVPGIDSTAVLYSTELATLVGSSDWMFTFLCDLWDKGRYEYDTKHQGSFKVENMCISLLGACVPEYIRKIDKNTGEAINGGFTARSLFIFASEKSQSLPWPVALESTPEGRVILEDLFIDLERISKLSGEFVFTPEAKILWERNYATIQLTDEDSSAVRHFKSRQGPHIMKVAMCISAATNDSLVIDGHCMSVAISLVAQVLSALDIVFRGVGESPLAEATARVQSFIELKGMVARKEILKHAHRFVTSEDLDRILAVLINIDFCDTFSQGGKIFYRCKDTNKKGTV